MTTQEITSELRQWIVEQAAAGQPPQAVLDAMLASGWHQDVAVKAIEDSLRDYLREHDRKESLAALPEPVEVPSPPVTEGAVTVQAGERVVNVLLTMREPRVVVFGNFLSHDECDELMELARPRLVRSETVQVDTGTSEVNVARTSDGMFFNRAEHPVCERIEARIAALLNWPIENGEGLQILRYRPGAEYKPHYDYFDPVHSGTPTILKRGGQRVATVIMYLNTPQRGGATSFPDVNLEIGPLKGNALFFSYDRAHPVTKSLHGGSPLLEGEKWVATKWLRQARFD